MFDKNRTNQLVSTMKKKIQLYITQQEKEWLIELGLLTNTKISFMGSCNYNKLI